MSIELVKVRAEISVGTLTVVTPFIQSFNVQKTRGQVSTFSAQLKVDSDQLSGTNVGGLVSISAGANGTMNKIYTGILKKSTITPCWDDPGYVMWNISGEDCLSLLNGKKYTRRCRATKYSWVAINSVVREGLRDGKFDAKAEEMLETDPGETTKKRDLVAPPTHPQPQSRMASSHPKKCAINVTLLNPDSEEATVTV
jgi:hypothetical protein